MDSTIREAEMPAIGPPLHQFSPPLPEDHIDIFGDPAFRSRHIYRHIYHNELVQTYIQAGKHVREWLQEMYPSINLPLGVLPEPNMQPQYQFTNKIPSFTANLVTNDIIIQERTALDNLPPPSNYGLLPDPKILSQYQFTNKIPSTANPVKDDIMIQERTAMANLPRQRVLPNPNMFQYRLQFVKMVQNPSFTNHLVRDDNGSPIKVAIYDMSTQSIISPDNFLSSAKVGLTVLNAEFVENKGDTMSRGDFNQSMLKVRERKGPILTGCSRIIQLQNGVGTFKNIFFNDNSSWTKSGFCLGVMVVSDREEGYFKGERVQEGVSEPFRVKDRRGKASQKPDQLKLTHKVQSLKKVGKDRASLLQKKKINTVEDFLTLYYNDEPALREILGIKSESGKVWDSMVEHATQCADEYHAKYSAFNNSSQPQQALDRPMEGNLSLSTNGGRSVVGCGSSQQNPSDEDLNEFLNSLDGFGLDL